MATGTVQGLSAMECFVTNVLNLMRLKGITQEDLAELSGVARPSISRILHRKEKITVERAERIAKALGVKLSKLFEITRQSA